MTTWVIIPAKSPRAAKTRLAPALAPAARSALALRLLRGAVAAARGCAAIDGVVVVSGSAELRRVAAEMGACAYADPAAGNLDPMNAAIAAGCRHALALGATAALVLPADLPLIEPGVITELLDEAGDAAVALAPDREGTGTNALLLRPPLALAPAFGVGSFARHRAAARALGLGVATVRLPELAFDLDTPDDLALLCRGAGSEQLKELACD